MRYTNTQITFQEVPGLVTRCFSIANCGGKCKGCHSPELRKKNIGEELTIEVLDKYLKEDSHKVDCYVFLGDGKEPNLMYVFLEYCKKHNMKTCIYLGHMKVFSPYLEIADYIKVGCYREDLGGLDSPTTNQRMFKNITSEFYKSKK